MTRRSRAMAIGQIAALMIAFSLALWARPVASQDLVELPAMQSVFDRARAVGVFVLQDPDSGNLLTNDVTRATQRFYPASTFKVANTLIALETGAVGSVDEVVPYGGGRTFIPAWAQDMSLRDALPISNLPVYQNVARRVGMENYELWLDRLGYGNADPGWSISTFWLSGPLAISAVEQVAFLGQLAGGQLDASAKAQSDVRDIMRIERDGTGALFAKTGWTTTPDPDIGWFVGWVETDGRVIPFALNIDMRGRVDAPLRTQIAREILTLLGHL